MKYPILLFQLCFTVFLNAQQAVVNDSLNQTDSVGKRTGYWKITAAMLKRTDFPSPESIVEEGPYLNGQKNGWWTQYYQNGKVRSRMTFVSNRPNGTATLYFENGNVQETGTWKGTRWVGEYKLFYENDTLRHHFNYNNLGQKHGMQYLYHPNGKLAKTENFKDGKEDGWKREYDSDGTLLLEQFFSPIADSCKTYRYQPKNPRKVGDYGDGDPTGPRGTEEGGRTHPVEEHSERDECQNVISTKQKHIVDSVLQTIPCYHYNDSLKRATPKAPGYDESSNWNGNDWAILYKCKEKQREGWFQKYLLVCGAEYLYDPNGSLIRVKFYEEGKFVKEISVD